MLITKIPTNIEYEKHTMYSPGLKMIFTKVLLHVLMTLCLTIKYDCACFSKTRIYPSERYILGFLDSAQHTQLNRGLCLTVTVN